MFNLNKKKQLISKSEILKQHNELEIFQKYINDEINIGSNILSPLRNEKNPSFGFFIGEGNEICFNDFLLGKGDFIQFLRLKFGLTYFEALSKVACDFDMQDDYICKHYEKSNNNYKSNVTKDELLSKYTGYQLGKKSRDWNASDVLFWRQFGIGKKTLDFYNVEPIKYIFIGDKCFKADDYTYCFTEMKDGIETYKIYQPYNVNYKWINNHNNSVWSGWTQLPLKGEDLIITKSTKDLMCIAEICNIPAVSLQSENVIPKREVVQQLKERFDVIYLLYDNDFDSEKNWGRIFADKLSKEFGFIDIYIDDKFKCKDFSDLVKSIGRDKAKNVLLNQTMLPF